MWRVFKTVFALAGLVLLACAVWYLGFYQPQISRRALLRQETEQLSLQLQSFRVSDQQLRALASQIDTLRAYLEGTRRRLVPKSELPMAIELLRRQGRKYGLKFEQIIPDYDQLLPAPDAETSAGEVLPLTVHLKMQGRYRNFGRFVASLPALPFFVSLGEVSLVYNEAVHPEIDILTDAILFLRNSGRPART